MRLRRPAIELIVVQVLLAIYGGVFIAHTSFTFQGERTFSLCDPAMITMRHARDLAAGHGWSWAALGDQPLWTLWMAAMHRLPLSRSTMSLAVQITSLVLLLVNLGFVRAIVVRGSGSRLAAGIALLLIAGFYPLTDAALQGANAGLLAALMSCSAWLVVRRLPVRRGLALVWPVLLVVAATGAVFLNNGFDRSTSWKRWALIERPAGVKENRRHVEMAERLASMTTVRATIAAATYGCLGYFGTRTCIDVDSIGILHPDVIVAPWDAMESHFDLARYHGYDLGILGMILLRRDSNEIVLDASDRLANQLWWDGLALQNQGRIDEALDNFAGAIALAPPNDTWPYHFGALLVERRSLAEVESYYDSIAAQDRKPHISEYCRGVALARAGKLDQAVERFHRALGLDPAHEMSYEMLGNVLAVQGRFEAANEFYRTAIEIVPEYASAHRNLAASLQRLGRNEEAQRHLQRAAEGDPNPAQRCYYWGRYLLEHGHAGLAIAPLEHALRSDPDHAASRHLLQRARREAAMATATVP